MRRTFMPTVIRNYLVREFLGLLFPILIGFVLLYVIIDLFEKLDVILRNQASLSAVVRYFAYKLPLMVTQLLPPAVVVSTLLTYGLLSRRNEITAFRAGGIGLFQSAAPILLTVAAICSLALLWNEQVVPRTTQQHQRINLLEIKKRDRRSLLSDREIWYHGKLGFYHIRHVDVRRKTLFDVTIYHVDSQFSLTRLTLLPVLQWDGSAWRGEELAEQISAGESSPKVERITDGRLSLPERFDDFLEVQQEPEELSFVALRDRIEQLRRKGIDSNEMKVDLHLKLAIPLSSLVLAWIAIPIAGRIRQHPSIAAIVGIGAIVGFGYWVTLGFSSSLGQNGVLSASAAAWSANVAYAVLGSILFLHGE
jgi:lipopolysaccharide export system permease protein